MRDIVQQIDRGVPVYDVKTFDRRVRDTVTKPRFYATAVLFFGGLAFLLSVIGVYSLCADSISRRTQEMGVRLAVGASPYRLRAMLLRENLIPIALGASVGVAVALGLSRFLRYLIAGIGPASPGIYAGAAGLLILTAAIAIWVTTARILSIDPSSALRTN